MRQVRNLKSLEKFFKLYHDENMDFFKYGFILQFNEKTCVVFTHYEPIHRIYRTIFNHEVVYYQLHSGYDVRDLEKIKENIDYEDPKYNWIKLTDFLSYEERLVCND